MEVVNAGESVGDVVVLGVVSVWVVGVVGSDTGAVDSEGEGSGVGVESGVGSEDGTGSGVGVGLEEGSGAGSVLGAGVGSGAGSVDVAVTVDVSGLAVGVGSDGAVSGAAVGAEVVSSA